MKITFGIQPGETVPIFIKRKKAEFKAKEEKKQTEINKIK